MSGSPKVAVVYPGDRDPRDRATSARNRFSAVCDEFERRGAHAEPACYRDEFVEEVRQQLRGLDAALVWVDPLHDGRDRSVLDDMLRDVAASGVFVSAHPDTILKMGTKEVLFRTRDMRWSSGDIRLYGSLDELRHQLPARLASGGSRVLKQNRGNGGNGVWRVELSDRPASDGPPAADPVVRVLHALRGSREQEMRLSEFVAQCEVYFERAGLMIDQPFQSPVPDGMVRCYMTHDEVVGFGHQFVTALIRPEIGSEAPPPQPRLYYPPSQAAFQSIRARMEEEWIPQLARAVDVPTESLPVLWDADFVYGPKRPTGEDTYVLCEINVSSVSPFPDAALPRFVDATLRRIQALR